MSDFAKSKTRSTFMNDHIIQDFKKEIDNFIDFRLFVSENCKPVVNQDVRIYIYRWFCKIFYVMYKIPEHVSDGPSINIGNQYFYGPQEYDNAKPYFFSIVCSYFSSPCSKYALDIDSSFYGDEYYLKFDELIAASFFENDTILYNYVYEYASEYVYNIVKHQPNDQHTPFLVKDFPFYYDDYSVIDLYEVNRIASIYVSSIGLDESDARTHLFGNIRGLKRIYLKFYDFKEIIVNNLEKIFSTPKIRLAGEYC